MSPYVIHPADVRTLLARVSGGPMLPDLAWEIIYVRADDPPSALAGYLIRASFARPDRDTGTIGRGAGRWWFIECGSGVDGAIKTAWLALRQIVEHEAMEGFTVDGARPFDPHAAIADLIAERPR